MPASTPAYIPDNVFVELGLANLPEDRKMQMLQQMNELVHKRTMLKILESVPEEARKSLDAAADMDPEKQMNELLKYVPNLPGLIVEQVEQVKNEVKASLMEAQGQ